MRHPVPPQHLDEGQSQDADGVSFGVIFNFHGITPYFSNLLVAMTVTKRLFILNAEFLDTYSVIYVY